MVEEESSLEKYQKPSDKYSFGDTSDTALFYKALPYDNESRFSRNQSEPSSSSSLPSQAIAATHHPHPPSQGAFDPISLPMNFNLSNAIEWKEWNDIINNSDPS